jgi:hypothetical protein
MEMKTIAKTMTLTIAALLLTGLVVPAFAQLPNTTQSQIINWTDPKTGLVYEVLANGEYCLDMNSDSICDVTFINGTMVLDERPVQPTPTVTAPTSEDQSIGKCQGFKNFPTFCKTLLMPSGEIVQNKTWTYGCLPTQYLYDGICTFGKLPEPQTQLASQPTPQVEDAVGESGNDNDNNDNDDGGDDKPNPYCDKLNAEQKSNTSCHDRRDVDSETGIATCNDGTYKKDWRDCKDASGYDYDDDDSRDEEEDTGGSNPEGEEEDQSCGGESCTDDEKEDSTTDEDVGEEDE